MGKTWQLNYLHQIEDLIPKYCYISFKQDEGQLGLDATNFLILAASEYYLTGNIIQLLKSSGGDRELQGLTQSVLDDFIQLLANQNLIIMVCNRIEILAKLDNTFEAIDRATLNQLDKMRSRIKDKCPLALYPVTPFKKLKIKAGIGSLSRALANSKVEEVSNEGIDLDRVIQVLEQIRV